MASMFLLSVLSLLSALVLGLAVQTCWSALTSPLRRIPGPWYAGWTAIPLKIAIVTKRQVHFYHALHQRHGAFVRIAPDEVAISEVEAFKEIHRMGTPFVKSRFYNYLNPTAPGEPPFNLFAETDPRKHAADRKLLARGFTQTALRDTWEDIVREKVTFAVQCIGRVARDEGGADVLKWWSFMAADIISNLMFGETFDLLTTGKEAAWFYSFGRGTGMNAIAWHFPALYSILKMLPVPSLQRAIHASRLLYDQGKAAVTNSKPTAQRQNLFAKVMAQAEKNEGTLTDQEIFVQAGAFCLAGTDTTANTLTYLVWAVLSRPGLQAMLEEEVRDLPDPLLDADLEKLPVLNAVIKETLRLFGAAPGAEPRISPGVELGGYYLPAGTTVSTQPWTMHRDPNLFENPDEFDYSRWLPSAPPMSERANAAYWPFGAGSRICIGIHLAWMELRIATAMFFRECKGAVLAPSVTAASMEIENIALISPVGGECKIKLRSSTGL